MTGRPQAAPLSVLRARYEDTRAETIATVDDYLHGDCTLTALISQLMSCKRELKALTERVVQDYDASRQEVAS